MLIKHLRDKKGNPYATMVAVKEGEKVSMGFSKSHPKYDNFIKQKGVDIAYQRSRKGHGWRLIPYDIEKNLEKFKERCSRYYGVSPDDVKYVEK